MKLKQLILSSIALGALAFTVGMAQPAHAAIGIETPAPAQNLEKPASVTTHDPFDGFFSAEGVRNGVQTVSHNAVNALEDS